MKVEWKSCFRIGVSAFLLYLCITYWTAFSGLFGTFIGAAMPLLIGCVIAKIPGAIASLVDWLETTDIVPEDMLASLQNVDWKSKIDQVIFVLTNGVGNVMGTAVNVVSSVFSGIVTALFAFIFSIYLLTGKEKLGNQFDRLMKRYMKESVYSKTKYVLSVANDCFHKYIVGQCTEAVILGTLCAIGMMILTVSPMKAILFLIYIVILQQLENNLIYPKVVGSSMGLPAIWVLAAVTIGGGVMGIAGMMIGVPMASVLYRLLREDVNKGAKKEVLKV